MLQFLVALGLAAALALSSHVQPLDGSGGPPNPKPSPLVVASPAPTVAPLDGSGGPPNT